MYLSRIFENLKSSFTNVMRKYENISFEDDIFTEMSKHDNSCLVKPNPCYDKIPLEVYNSLLNRMSSDEMIELFSSMFGKRLEADEIPATLEKAFAYLKKRITNVNSVRHTDIYSKQGMVEFVQTGKLTDHLDHLPAFNREEINKVLEHINARNNDPKDKYILYITEDGFAHNDFIFSVYKDFGIIVEYVFPPGTEGLWKMILIQNNRLASIFFDYFENHLPLNKAMEKSKTNSFIQSLMDS